MLVGASLLAMGGMQCWWEPACWRWASDAAYNGGRSVRKTPMSSTDNPPVCPICHGEGTVLHVDEEVGCQVVVPCWACVPSTAREDQSL